MERETGGGIGTCIRSSEGRVLEGQRKDRGVEVSDEA